MSARILIVAGTARSDVPEIRLAGEAMRRLALTDAVLAQVQPADYPLPVFDGAQEALAPPQNARLLAGRLALQDGLVLIVRERGGATPAFVANLLEWIAAAGGEAAFRRLVVALAVVSDEPGGGALCAQDLRTRLTSLGAGLVAPAFLADPAATLFDEAGGRLSRDRDAAFDAWIDALLDHTRALGRHG